MCEYISTLIGVGGTLLGTLFGWVLSKPKVELCLFLQPQADFDDSTPYNSRTKTSDSGYSLHYYNNGDRPFLLREASLYYKGEMITQLNVQNVVVAPYSLLICNLNMQEYGNIIFYCGEKEINKCKAYVTDISGKEHIALLNLILPKIQADTRKKLEGEL